ncbi:LOW QUALITY PROTEIN: scavenger receptor class F member 1-like [Narcine bancroftii]|uniref:LOW QUALITY PROTEIN: scavenger receptor class F member 1-like n=1 Tax=Narcine bancroftii TaxID=1343680 RepID=UPI00383200ED
MRVLSSFSCCPGWRQEGNHCSVALCDGDASCRPGEQCVRPGECRCPHGYFGANCVTRCPDQFWGHDCREACRCHPNGQCDAVSGRCACYPDRWGWRCSQRCHCLHGVCEAGTGHCQCEPGWWGTHCSKLCQCQLAHSQCDQLTGRCNCSSGFWGRRCNIPCYCGQSPCTQRTGQCQCRQGWWGTLCDQRCVCGHGTCDPHSGLCTCHPGYQGTSCSEACVAGFYGQGCKNRCGHCKGGQLCSPVNGSCPLCQAGWQGSLCDQLCPPGFHGDGCEEGCPKCRDGESCNAQTGLCGSCNPGWTGPRCDAPCVSGTYGVGCRSSCPQCYHGTCHHVKGDCTCDVGYTGDRCNTSCQAGTYGMNCSKACGCLGASCDRVTGNCRLSKVGVAVAAVLLSLLLLCIPCCWRCRSNLDSPTSRAVDDTAPMVKMKHRVQGVLASLGSALPCLSFGDQKMPKITVLHHDAELSFNCSFIDSPSAGGDSVSCSSDGESPLDSTLPLGGTLPQQVPAEPWEAASEERLQPADIPRTSSMAKAKRPSVSFAEGTRFGPQPRRSPGSEPRPPPLALPHWKRKPLPPSPELPASASPLVPGKSLAGRAQPAGGRGMGRWSRMRDVPVEGVQAVLRRFGSFQRQRGSGERSPGAPARKGQSPGPVPGGEPPGSGTLGRKPLIPATPVLRQLVAGVAAQSGAGLAVVPAGGSLPPDTPPDSRGCPGDPGHDPGPG